MLLERFIIRRAERWLQPYRVQAAAIRKERAAEYQKYEPEIAALYGKATHWHGTGRFRYERTTDVSYDVLAKILEAGGLQPYRDPWIDSGAETVSLATVRTLARQFARVHAYEKSTFVYELGSVKFWHRLYFFLLSVWMCTDFKSQRTIIGGVVRGTFFRDLMEWESAIRKSDGKARVSVLNITSEKTWVSDIPGNYPVLIGMALDAKDLIATTPIARKIEQRSLRPVSLQQFTHIEVPLANIAETERLLRECGVSLPVIPLEFGDLYLADTSLEKLTFAATVSKLDDV